MKRLKSYFFTNSNLNSRGKYISFKDNAEPNETLFNDLLDSVVKPKVGADYQDQADFNAVNTKDSSKFVTAENLPEVDSSGSLLTITTTAAVDTNLLRRKKYTVSANIPSSISDIFSRLTTKLVTPANLPKFALDNSEYNQVASQLPYFAPSVVVTTDGVDFYQTYSLKLRALESTMMTHAGVRLDTVLDGLRTDVNACVSDSELTSAVNSLNLAINNKATKVSPNFVTGYNGTKVTVNSQGIVTTVTKASASDITNDSSVSGSTVKDALNWLKANGGGTGGASDTDGVTNLSDVPGGTTTDALNNLSDSIAAIVPFISSDVEINAGNTSGWTTPTFNVSPLVNYRVAAQSANIELVLPSYTSADLNKVILVYKGFDDTRVTTFTGYSVILSKRGDCVGFICTSVGWLPFTTSVDWSANLALKADINSPTFTGIPAGPTASPGTNTTQLATTAFVTTALSSFVGGATYQSTWNASTNTPTLASGVGTKGYYYVVSVDGSTNLDGVTDWKVGDWAIYNGTAWQKVDNTDAISSFNGSLGAITYTPTGTADRVTITGASGLTPTIDIASTYTGQTSITTLGTIGTGTWQGTAIADAYIASASTWNGKFNTPTGLTTSYLPYWDGTKFVNSLLYDNGTTLGYNNTTNNSRILTSASVNIADILLAATTTQFRFFNYGISTQYGSITATSSVLSINSTTQLNLFAFSNNVEVQYKATETLMRNELFTFTRQASNSATVFASLNNNGLALGSLTINALTQLDLQSTTKGLGLNLIAGNLSTTRNGLIWYDTVANQFEGVQNGSVVSLLSGSGLTTNNTLKWNGSQIVNANETDNGTTITSTLNRVFTGASASNNGTGANSNKFRFNGVNTIGTGSFIQVDPEMQFSAPGVGGSLRGILYLDASANSYVNNGYTQLFLNSGGDLINSKISLRRAICINHRSSDNINNANHNSSAVTIDATMYRPNIAAVSAGSSGVHHITSVNADNYSSIIQDGASGQRPVNYSAYSLRTDAIGFSNVKNISASSSVQNGNVNAIQTTNTSYSSGFGFSVVNIIANSNASPQIVNLQEEYIVANAGAGTSNAGKRYRHENINQGAASAYIMGLYRTGVIIGDTTALPNSNASLHLQSTSKGFLPNVLTTAQRDAVSWVAGDAGMIIYNSTTNKHQGWNGSTWNDLY